MKKACRYYGQGTATPSCVRLLLQNRGLLSKRGSQSKTAAKKIFSLLSGKQKKKRESPSRNRW